MTLDEAIMEYFKGRIYIEFVEEDFVGEASFLTN